MIRNVLCRTTPVSRAAGHTAIGGAAYRAGVNLKARGVGPNGEDKWYRYSNKGIVVRESFILTPEGAPAYATNRAELWNRVEEMETRKNARLGRDMELGLAYELSHDEQRALIREFALREFVDRGFVVDVSIHNYGSTLPAAGASEEQQQRIREWAAAGVPFLERSETKELAEAHVMIMRNRDGEATGYKLYQPHAHLRITPRVCKDGEFVQDKKASRDLNSYDQAMSWRYEWPKLQNEYLERAGFDVRVSSTSAEEDRFPDIRFLGSGRKPETQAIEERVETLTEEQRALHEEKMQAKAADEAFRQMHNESIRDAFLELDDEQGSSSENGERTRLALWWHNTAQRFNSWRFEFKEAAAEWRERFELQRERIRRIIGWHDTPEKDDASPNRKAETGPKEHNPREQEPDR